MRSMTMRGSATKWTLIYCVNSTRSLQTPWSRGNSDLSCLFLFGLEKGSEGKNMKQSEAVRIPALLRARQPRPVVEEANIEGTRMLVILGNEVDTVIRYNRNGAADMPQLASYQEVAESAAHADERLAKQRASGRVNTTGEG